MSEPDTAESPREPLAVIGLSCLFPKAADVGEFWSNVRRGVDAITEIPSTHWSADDYFDADPKSPDKTYARRGGFLSPVEFDPLEFGIAPSNLEAIDTSQLLGLVGAKRALEDAGYGAVGFAEGSDEANRAPAKDGSPRRLGKPYQLAKPCDRSRVGCILGVTGTLEMVIPLGARLGQPKWRQALKDAGVADDVAEDVIQRIGESYVPWQENSFPGLLGNVVAGRIANRLDLGGTNCVVDAACASSLSAMHLAALELWSGRADMMITGGIDTFNDIFMYMCFSKTPALSPTGDAKPFSDMADGTILGEGVGMFVLKRLSDAERDGDRIYALIRGIGTSSDGAGNAVYAPKKEGQIRCLQDAYRVAGVSPDTVELIEAHGTGTKVGDATELAGLTEVFQATGQTGRWCAVGSIKSQIGHTKAAAGAAGVLKAILSLKHRVLPPTIKIDRPLPALLEGQSPIYANSQAKPWLPNRDHPRRAGVSAFGFGGSNFHCVLEESPSIPAENDWDDDVFFAAFSAESRDGLQQQLSDWAGIDDRKQLLQRAAQSRRRFDSSQGHRLVIVADPESADLTRLVQTAQNTLRSYADRSAWSTPDGIFYGSGPRAGKLGLLFPGQGSQYVGMQRELACRFPALQNVLTEANEVFAELSPKPSRPRLSDYIYPIPAFDEATKATQEAELRDTEIAQPAIGAVSLGQLAVLAEFGVKPEVVAGHSYGELTALCASKRFAPAALYRLSMLRGKLMAEAQEIEGGMLAVGAPLSQVEAALQEAEVDLVIANRNSPSQVVLSGRITELDRATDVFARRNIRGKRLPVAAAFHSPLVASASERFLPVLEDIEFSLPEVPVFANTHAEEYPSDPNAARLLLAGQLAQPVEFVRQIENMYAAGVRLFLEVGPGAVLTGLVNSILSGRDHRAIAVDASSGKRSGMLDLALALGQLAAGGYPVVTSAWNPSALQSDAEPASGSPRLTIPICGANYVKPRTPRPPRSQGVRGEGSGIWDEGSGMKDQGSRVKDEGSVEKPRSVPRTQSPARSAESPKPAKRQAAAAHPPSDRQPSTLNPQPSPALTVLQQMFEQTARLHRQFLEGQEAALKTLEQLVTGSREPGAGNAFEVRDQRLGIRDQGPEISDPRSKGGIPPVTQYPIPSTQYPMACTESPKPAKRQAAVVPPPSDPQSPTPNPQLTSDVLAVVAEKTGYPVEMLKPEMSLDHDLGIDSIKRVEILSALQERRPDLPAVQPDQLGTLHRLEDVIALLNEGRDQGAGIRDQGSENGTAHSVPGTDSRSDAQITIRVPQAVPLASAGSRLPLAIGSTVFVTDDGTELSKRIAEQLTELGCRARLVGWGESESTSIPDHLAGLIVIAPKHAISDSQLWQALDWTKKCGAALRESGRRGAALLATVSRLDGRFGFTAGGNLADPLSGALSGLAKTVWLEWPEVSAKAVDVGAGDVDVNDLVEHFLADGPSELGVDESGWHQIVEFAEGSDEANRNSREEGSPRRPGKPYDDSSPPVQPGDLVVITGGARGVTAAAAVAVAQAWRPRLLLCGRTPPVETEPEGIANCETLPQIKQVLAQRSPAGTSPRAIDNEARQVLAQREIRATLDVIRRLGVAVDYVALDIRDARAVDVCFHEMQREHGPIRGVIHGAGVLEDRKIDDKTREQFDKVWSTKVVGLRNILAAIDADQLRCLGLFSSYTARYGRIGQVDYAMANEALNKLSQAFQAEHPQCRVRSFNWGPWDGGMVTDSLKPLFAKEGVGLIPLAAGADVLIRELERPESSSVEVLVLAEKSRESRAESREPAEQPNAPQRATDNGQRSTADSPLANLVLTVVAERTGYPVEMLKPEMSLDHDLGIDSIKRVEILSALQERRPDLPVVQPEQLGTLHRLEDVIRLLDGGLGVRDQGSEMKDQGAGMRDQGVTLPPSAFALPPSNPQPSTLAPQPSAGRVGWERNLSVSSHPYLASHVLGGKAVLPTAMIVEILAHAAVHHHPGLDFVGLSNLRIFKGLRLDREEDVRLRGMVDKAIRTGNEFRIPTRLVSRDENRETLHAQAEILLSSVSRDAQRSAPRCIAANHHSATPRPLPADWYDSLLFHGPQFQGLTAIESLTENGIVVVSQTAAPPAEWCREPWRSAWLADPLAIDVALQALIVWTQTVCGTPSLPTSIGEYRQFRPKFPADGVRIALRVERRNPATAVADVEFFDRSGELIAAMTGLEHVLDAQLTEAFRRNSW